MEPQLGSLPLFDSLKACKTVLLAGAGGGYDITSGVPLYFALRAMGKEVILANLSFTALSAIEAKVMGPIGKEINADCQGYGYFPEGDLCKWFRTMEEEVSIYAFPLDGVQPILQTYEAICEKHDIDAVVLVDGGTDSLIRGNEAGLGTPSEDMASIAAVDLLPLPHKYLVCLGFGIDRFHGICHAQFLENTASLSQTGAYLGAFSLLPQMPEAQAFLNAVEFLNQRNPGHKSIVANSIASSLEGHYGNHHKTERTRGSRLWINPLMALYWCYRLDGVVDHSLLVERLQQTQTRQDVIETIKLIRTVVQPRGWEDIPV